MNDVPHIGTYNDLMTLVPFSKSYQVQVPKTIPMDGPTLMEIEVACH